MSSRRPKKEGISQKCRIAKIVESKISAANVHISQANHELQYANDILSIPSNPPPLPPPRLLLILSNLFSFQSSPPPGGVDFNAGGNGGTLLMEEGSKRDAKTETIFEEPLDDQLSSG